MESAESMELLDVRPHWRQSAAISNLWNDAGNFNLRVIRNLLKVEGLVDSSSDI